MSVEKFIITKEDTHFSIIPNHVAQGLKDAEALGLWIFLQTLPPNWEFHKTHIKNHFGWGRDKLDKKLSLLKECNLAEPLALRDENGKFTVWTLNVRNGREFIPIHNTDFQCSGELSTGFVQKPTHNTENTAAVKPVTGFDTPIKETSTKEKGFKKKSFCATAQKKSKSDWKAENAKVHDFAESKNQVANEASHIEKHEAIKRVPMPDSLRSLVKKIKISTGGCNHESAKKHGRMQKDIV